MPGGRIVGFRIASGDVIDSIRFMYEDESHNKHHSNTYGGDGGTLNPPVNFDRDEDIIRFISISALFKHSSLLVPEKLQRNHLGLAILWYMETTALPPLWH
ncbi:hypothetical protein L6452_35869 [Arctium lappa]|uniref:Uncharacterized protein n=2 Tax=Arctium lappa TaxID=4217 RepID=A0ACB8Y6X8_ARCLA|nr:hypothetical protein L6452_35868 [Arctium lappa]KAI3681087.1 hypothetical protein L6452_35869 [Arctium lappa]